MPKKIKGYLDPRDSRGVVHNLRKTLIKDLPIESPLLPSPRPFKIGDKVLYLGQVKKYFSRIGVLIGERDKGGFYILYLKTSKEGEARGSVTPGSIRLLSPKEEKEATKETL